MLEIKSDIRLIVEDSMVVRSESGSVYVVIKLLVESIIEIVVFVVYVNILGKECLLFCWIVVYWLSEFFVGKLV